MAGKVWSGECSCGAVKWEVRGDMRFAGYCHCNACRAFTGGNYYEYAAFNLDEYHITQGADLVDEYTVIPGSDYRRSRCGKCGCFLACTKQTEPKWLSIPLGHLRDYERVPPPSSHVNYDFKLPWVNFDNDGIQKFAGMPS